MKSTGKKFVIGVLLSACIYWVSCGKDKSVDSNGDVANANFVAKESFSFKVRLFDHTRLRLEAISGSVAITGESGSDSVLITGERRVGSESTQDAEEHLQLLQVTVQDLGNEIFVKTSQPDQTHGRSYVVDYSITLPESLDVLVDHVSGIVEIASVDNGVSVDHVSGQVSLDEVFGSAQVNLISGEIEAQVTLPKDGIINFSLVSGSIELNIPQNTSAEFSAKVTSGTISISDLVLQNQVSTTDSVTGTLGSGEGTISLNVFSGFISVSGF
jgi:DUF4097 and DUF4098 domain-containing protein YvlB